MARWCRGLTIGVSMGLLCLPAWGRDVKLELRPQKIPGEPGKCSLLPAQESLVDRDAVPLYDQAVQALPGKAGEGQIQEWLKMPIDQLPAAQVEEVLARDRESLKGAARAVKCRQCNWPPWVPGKEPINSAEYRRLAFAIRLWARLEIARDGFDGALLALQTELGMARHLGQAPTLAQVLLGTASGHATCREIEEFVQREGSPNLYPALARLPKPFVDVEKAIENETKVASSGLQGKLLGEHLESQMKAAHDLSRAIVRRFDCNLAALQCVEAIRSYAASHGGQLPGTLSDITEVSLPKDPTSGAPFRYTRTEATATLESFLPAGGDERERIRYVISIKP